MFRSLFGFALLAVVAWFALQLFFALFGIVVGLLGKILWLAFLGFLVYLVLRIFAPTTADRVKEMVSGKPSSTV
jgi:predicted lipid-binding transport protein (Tim44 family)